MENGKLELFLVAALTIFSGCGGTPTLDLSTKPAPVNITINPSTPASAPLVVSPSSQTVDSSQVQNLKYYKSTQTVTVPKLDNTYTTPVGSNKVTFTGYCMYYLKNRYCWDDGIKTVTFKNPGSQTGALMTGQYTYWSMSTAPNMFGTQTTYSYGSIGHIQPDDLMSQPKLVDQGSKLESMMETNDMQHIATYGARNVDQFMVNSIAVSVQCIDDGKVLNCGSFSIDLTQDQL